MAAAPPRRRRARRGSLDRPVSSRIYRAAWALVTVPLLVAAFSVARPQPLPPPALPPTFDQTTAVQFANEIARQFPDRSPGTTGSREAADWVEGLLEEYGFTVERQPFEAEVPGRGHVQLVNLVAVARMGETEASPQSLVVSAHRDNLGRSPGANDNASGTAALLELAREFGGSQLAHTLVFVSTDGGAYGSLGEAAFARESASILRRFGVSGSVVAAVNLDAIAGQRAGDVPRLQFTGDVARSPTPALLATAEASILAQAGLPPDRPGALSQLIDLAFPFTLYGQGPFIADGISAVTLTTATDRPPSPTGDTLSVLDHERLGTIGRAAQALVTSLDQAAEVARGSRPIVYLGSIAVRGWTIQFVLLTMLLPFLAATVDLFARSRRRHVALLPALRSLRSRLGVWVWAGAVFAFFALVGILPNGEDRPIAPDADLATSWPATALVVLGGLAFLGWLVVRPRLVPSPEAGSATRADELAGHLVAMLALAVIALVVAATNPFALIFILPSLHAWLWLPQLADRRPPVRLAVCAAGLAGPLLLLGSFALRFNLGLDAPWYLIALASIGYVQAPLLLAFLAWAAVSGQVVALAAGRYAPYPSNRVRPRRGPVREGIRQIILLHRAYRRRRAAAEPEDGSSALES
jgi:hypothetical protein